MRKLYVAAAACLIALASLAARAPELTKEDRDSALRYLESTRKNIEEATQGLSDEQWNFKPGPGRWSVAQVMEHIAAAEDMIRGMIVEKVLKAPAAPDRDTKKLDAMVLAAIPDRSTKFQAPEPLRPTNRFGSPDGSLKHFLESRAKTEALLKDTPDLRDHAVDSPMGQKLDAYEWILFIAAHSDRHLKQMKEVQADPNYPKK
ncbi:MAG TPA: DinB family protein [Candidatus Acidoferrales bacterium]|nr:DinB family protein [Candidatus Acidoferrales bacterium]